MTGSVPGFGGQGYVTQETRALSSIAEGPDADLSGGQEALIRMLQSHDYQLKFLAGQVKQAQQGVNEANQNPIQQVQKFIADIIVLLGGGELATGALDFGDLQYILPALGALFGFGDGPFPISLFQAAEKFFLGYVVPNAQFADVINKIIEAWLGVIGIDPEFIKDTKALITAIGELFDGISNLLPSLNELFGALGISAGDLGPLGQVLGPIIQLFSGLDLKKFGSMIEFITDAIDPFIKQLTAIINFIDSVLAVLGFHGEGGVVNSPLGDTQLPFANLASLLGNINFASPDFNVIEAGTTLLENLPLVGQLVDWLDGLVLGGGGSAGLDLPFDLPADLPAARSAAEQLFAFLRMFIPVDMTDPLQTIEDAAEKFAQLILKPTNILAWLDPATGVLPDVLSPKLLLSVVDAMKQAAQGIPLVGGVVGGIIGDAWNVISQLLGLSTGAQSTANSTQAAITALQAGSTVETVPGGVKIVDEFSGAYSTTLSPTDWVQIYTGPGAGTLGRDGSGNATWFPSGGVPNTVTNRSTTPLATDNFEIQITVPTAMAANINRPSFALKARMNAAGTEWVGAIVTAAGQGGYLDFKIGYKAGGIFTQIGDPGYIAVGFGDRWKFRGGYTADERQFVLLRNDVEVMTRVDSTDGSFMDASHRYPAFDVTTGTDVFSQIGAPVISVFAATDKAL